MKKRYTLLTLALALMFSSSVFAQYAGNLNLNFNGTGYNRFDFFGGTDVVNDIAVQSDKKIVAAGIAFTPTWNVELEVIRLNENGTLDQTFGDYGVVSYTPQGMSYFEAHAMAVVIQPDNKILVAGGVLNNNGIFNVLLIRLNTDGSYDNTFGTNGVAITSLVDGNDMAHDVVIGSGGKIYIAGTADNSDYNIAPMVACFNSNGSLNTTFGTAGFFQMPVIAIDNEFTSISLQNDGKILASGHYSNVDWTYVTLLARFNSDGNLDPTFADNGASMVAVHGNDDEFFGMDLNSAGEIIVGGFTRRSGNRFDMLLMKYNTNGDLVSSFGTNGIVEVNRAAYNVIYDLKVQPDDKIVAAGSIGAFAPGDNDFALLRFLNNGTLDNQFGTNGVVLTQFFGEQDEANSVALSGNDKIYVGGKTLNSTDGIRDFTVACYNNDLHVGVIKHKNYADVTVTKKSNEIFEVKSSAVADAIEIYNVKGEILGTHNFDQTECTIDLSVLPTGIYMYRLMNKSKVISAGKLGLKL